MLVVSDDFAEPEHLTRVPRYASFWRMPRHGPDGAPRSPNGGQGFERLAQPLRVIVSHVIGLIIRSSDDVACCVGVGRSALPIFRHGGILRPALRTGCACLHASGCPHVQAAGAWSVPVANLPMVQGFSSPDIDNG